jgi:hypothetical protein
MPINIRIATFNLENLDDKSGQKPTLNERIALMRPQLFRIDADILALRRPMARRSQDTRVVCSRWRSFSRVLHTPLTTRFPR